MFLVQKTFNNDKTKKFLNVAIPDFYSELAQLGHLWLGFHEPVSIPYESLLHHSKMGADWCLRFFSAEGAWAIFNFEPAKATLWG